MFYKHLFVQLYIEFLCSLLMNGVHCTVTCRFNNSCMNGLNFFLLLELHISVTTLSGYLLHTHWHEVSGTHWISSLKPCYLHWHVSLGTPSPLSNQCPFEADTAHLVRGHDLTDSEVSAFQTSGMSSIPWGERERERERERARSNLWQTSILTSLMTKSTHTLKGNESHTNTHLSPDLYFNACLWMCEGWGLSWTWIVTPDV